MFLMLALSLLLGCGHTSLNIKKSDMTGSPCYDGVLANIISEGCDAIHKSQVPGTDAIRIRCEESKTSGPWVEYTFYFSQEPSEIYRKGFVAVCADPMYYGFWG